MPEHTDYTREDARVAVHHADLDHCLEAMVQQMGNAFSALISAAWLRQEGPEPGRNLIVAGIIDFRW